MKKPGMLLLLFLCCIMVNGEPRPAPPDSTFDTILTGREMVPPNNSLNLGHGWFTLVGDRLHYSIGGFQQSFYATGGAIYGPAAPGQNGKLVMDHLAGGLTPAESVNYYGDFQVSQQQMVQLRSGLWYVVIRSLDFPDGELRGQIVPQGKGPNRPFEAAR